MAKKFILFFVFFLSFYCFASAEKNDCPAPDKIVAGLIKTFPRAKELKIESVSPSKISGFCEVVTSFGGPFKNIIYVDKQAKYCFIGQLIDLEKGENITKKRISELTKLSQEQIKKLEEFVAFTVGNSTKSLFFIIDPDCPFCKRLEKTLSELVKSNKVSIKVILMPLERLHPKAKAKSIALICDKKGWNELVSGYDSDNQCDQGKKKVENTIKFLSSLGIRGTPTLILSDGRIIRGALSKSRLVKILGL